MERDWPGKALSTASRTQQVLKKQKLLFTRWLSHDLQPYHVSGIVLGPVDIVSKRHKNPGQGAYILVGETDNRENK